MVTGLEVAVLLIVLAFLVGATELVRTVRPFIVNAVVGLFVLLVAEAVVGFEVAVTPIALAIVALGGFPGALLVLLLALFGVAFVP